MWESDNWNQNDSFNFSYPYPSTITLPAEVDFYQTNTTWNLSLIVNYGFPYYNIADEINLQECDSTWMLKKNVNYNYPYIRIAQLLSIYPILMLGQSFVNNVYLGDELVYQKDIFSNIMQDNF